MKFRVQGERLKRILGSQVASVKVYGANGGSLGIKSPADALRLVEDNAAFVGSGNGKRITEMRLTPADRRGWLGGSNTLKRERHDARSAADGNGKAGQYIGSDLCLIHK